MKIKLFPLVTIICTISFIMTSCLDNDVEEIQYSSESSITSFSIGTVHIDRMGKDKAGNDSAYVDTINCSNYPFTIDQLKRTIENKDSLPVGSHIDKLLTKVTADTQYIFYTKKKESGEQEDTLWSSTDSINFEEPVFFKVYGYSGISGTPYKVTINVHNQVPDSLEWLNYSNNQAFAEALTKQKAVYNKKNLYVFGQKSDNTPVVEYMRITDEGTPEQWQQLTGLPAQTDSYSALVWQNTVYFLAGQELYMIDDATQTPQSAGIQTKFSQLIAGIDAQEGQAAILYARNADGQLGYIQNNEWTAEENTGLYFPGKETRLSSVNIPVSYNNTITRTVVMCNSSDKVASVYQRMSNEDTWAKYEQNQPTVCPNMENITMIYYDKKLYAFGGKGEITDEDNKKEELTPFRYFFCSTDNGLTWEAVTTYVTFPQKTLEDKNIRPFADYYTESHGNYSCVVDQDNFIWIIWENGNISRGRINRLGFAPKW